MQQEITLAGNDRYIDRYFLHLEHLKQENLRRLHELGVAKKGIWEDKGFELQAKDLHELRVAAIMDEFTQVCFQPECQLFELTPDAWRQEMEEAQPELLFLESAWRGKEMLWRNKVVDYSAELESLVRYCHEKNIPVIFWCKEDPPHTDEFMHVAAWADVVFTTDIDAVELYKRELGHDNVYHMHFAAQPQLHNPLEVHERKDRFAFAGSYPSKYKERCRIFDDLSEYFISSRGLDIYDRNVLSPSAFSVFPDKYQPYILGGLKATEIDVAYKGYYFGINMNSVRESQTMFARRVFELMASNTVVVGNYSRGMQNYFGDLTISTDIPEEMAEKMQELCESREKMDKLRLAALRTVLASHLYEDRLDYIVTKVFGRSLKRQLPKVLVCARVHSQQEADRIRHMFDSQSYQHKELVLIGGNVSCEGAEILPKRNFQKKLPEAEYIAWFHSQDWYGKNYLLDMALATRYGDFDVIGKAERYVNDEGTAVRQSDGQAYRLQEMLPARCSMARREMLADVSAQYREGKILAIDALNYCEGWQEESCPIAEDMEIKDTGISLERLEEAASLVSSVEKGIPVITIAAQEMAGTIKLPEEWFTIREENGLIMLESRLQDAWSKCAAIWEPFAIDAYLDENGKLPIEILAASSFKLLFRCSFYDKKGGALDKKYVRPGRRERIPVPALATSAQLEIGPRGAGEAVLSKITIGENGFRMVHCCFLENKTDAPDSVEILP